ncbi:endonuclease domain-containing protein [Rhodohalobacter sp. 8-1]|uniref:endonuclease domain-containing protein n=1 Tax=Rhodohalobacter sp. 8-1 TaxID=3131972 RepID=UPI0030EF0976
MNSTNLYYNKNLKEFARKLRKQATRAEVKLWQELLRGRQMHGYKFLRQRPVLFFIADFMCKELFLIIEVDGYTHEWEEQWALDQKRQKRLEEFGFTILRFTDEEILEDIRNVESAIEGWVLDHPPAPLRRGNP